MNDNELIAWQVVDRCGDVQYTCLKQSTAEYIRDWLNAKIEDAFFNYAKRYNDKKIMLGLSNADSFSIQECEVIVG